MTALSNVFSPPAQLLDWFGLVLTSTVSFFSLFTMEELHWGHTGSLAKEKLSLIHPLHESFVQDQIAVISSGMSSSGFFLELYMTSLFLSWITRTQLPL